MGGVLVGGGGGSPDVTTGKLYFIKGTIKAFVKVSAGGTIYMETPDDKEMEPPGKIENFGICHWDAGDLLFAGEFINHGDFLVSLDAQLGPLFGFGIFKNHGLFKKTHGADTLAISMEFSNLGIAGFVVEEGIVDFKFAVFNHHDITTLAGTEVVLSGTGNEMLAGADFHGTGKFSFSGGETTFAETIFSDNDLEITGPDTYLIVDADFETAGDISMSDSATVEGTASLICDGTMTWSGGTVAADLIIRPGATLTVEGSDDKNLQDELDNEGTIEWTTGDFNVSKVAGKILNEGTFNMSSTGTMGFEMGEPVGELINRSTFNFDGTTGTLAIFVTNNGIFNVLDGTLTAEHAFTTNATHTLSIAGLGTFEYKGGVNVCTMADGSILTGDGIFEVEGEVEFREGFSTTTIFKFLTNGDAEFFEPSSTTGLSTLSVGASLKESGTGTMTFTDFDWLDGTVEVPLTVNGILTLGSGEQSLEDVLTANTTTNKSSGDLYIKSGGEFENKGTFNFSGGNVEVRDGGEFDNSGTFNWSAGTAKINDTGILNNSGTFTAKGSATQTLDFAGTKGDFQNDGTFINENAGNTVDIKASFTNAGVCKGKGNITTNGNMIFGGTYAPGLSPGILNFNGDFTNGSTLEIEILDGSGAGTGHDQLTATGNIALTGQLKVVETGVVPDGSYTIMRCDGGINCVSGMFTSTDLPPGYMYSIVNDGMEVIVTKSALPVELIHFTARQENEQVELFWETASELNNDFFNVQRAADDFSFVTIGRINGQGTTDHHHHYSLVDKNLPKSASMLYYRLQQHDLNGQIEYSKIIAVELTATQSFLVENIYQSDNNQLNILFKNNDRNHTPHIKLFDLSGRLMAQKNHEITDERETVTLATTDFRTGVYVLNIQAEQFYFSEKIFLK